MYNAPMNTDLTAPDCSDQKPWRFRTGQSGNAAGRPPGIVGGRTRSLQILDSISGNEDNVKLLAAAMDAAFKKNPLQFFQRVMKDLIPKESLLKIATETPHGLHWPTLQDSIHESEAQRENLRALRAEFPGSDSQILDLIVEENCPFGALRCQMQGAHLRRPGEEPSFRLPASER